MNKNFSLSDAVAIQLDNKYYDLHNCFDLCGVLINFYDNYVELQLRENPCADGEGKMLILSFSNVNYLDFSPGVLKKMIRDVAELGYKNPDDFDHDWILSEKKYTKSDHLFIRLAGDEFIRIYAESAVLTEKITDHEKL